MIPAPLPPDEADRLAALRACQLLDTEPEPGFDDLTALAAQLAGTPIALVSMVDAERQWFKSRVGLNVSETGRDIAFCAHAILEDAPLIVPETLADERFSANPLVTHGPRIRAYAGVPLRLPEGHRLGTLCVIDTQPRPFTAMQVEALQRLARQVVAQIELRRARDAALAAAQAKAQFLATMSHEIRTPLNGVIGMARLLVDANLLPAEREMAETLCDCGDHLLAVVNDVLDLSKLDSGRFDLDDQPFDAVQLVQRAAAMFEAAANAKGIALRVSVAPRCAALRRGDATRVRQVLLNLLGNAVKFTESGAIDLDLDGDATSLSMRVRDTGIGIGSDTVARLFAPFEQGSAAIAGQFGGTGLGLAIAARLVERMGGELDLASELGQGSEFTVRLPLGVAAPSQAPVSAPAADRGASVQPGLRVLVAEDNPVNALLVRHLLERMRCEVNVVSDGMQAVAAWRRGQFDAILMDRHMPVMDGVEAAQIIRSDGDQAVQPLIIALSAGLPDVERPACLQAGMDDYIEKPISLAALSAALAKVRRPSAPREVRPVP